MSATRRDLLKTAGGLGLAAAMGARAAAAPAKPAAVDAKVVLLGTKGGAQVVKGRANPANMVLVGDKPYVVDCGYGVTRQLMEVGIELDQLRNILLTNCLGDRIVELGPLLYNAWTAGLREPVQVMGPPPLRRMLRRYFESMAQDIELGISEDGRPDLTQLVKVREIEKSGLVFQVDGLKVSTTKVRHPPILNSLAYRFDTPNRSIVLSGATAFSPELVSFARNADVLVHEVMHLPSLEKEIAKAKNAPRLRKRLLAAHTSSTDVGRVAADAEVRTLVLTHFIPADDPAVTEETWMSDVKKSNFNGRVIVGRDLMTI